jgi:aminoglycoside phosphotransferase (APT) family kinase protein
MIVSLQTGPAVTFPLLEFLQWHYGVRVVRYLQQPTPILEGYESYIYQFQLQPSEGFPRAFSRPLILKLYSNHNGEKRLHHEFAVQRRMHSLGYPTPEPILYECQSDWFRGPFMIMEVIPGKNLLHLLLQYPWKIVRGPGWMAQMQARLHRLPTAEFSGSSEPFLERQLQTIQDQMEAHDLYGLLAGYDWLWRHRPVLSERPSIVHLDFHPINLMFEHDQCRGVLDWCDADVGDRHADVAVTLTLIRTAPVAVASFRQRLATWPGRWLLYRRYLRAYRRLLPLDDGKLSYYMAWAALRRLCRYGTWLRAGPQITGSKPACLGLLRRDRIDVLRRCFWEQTGVQVRL